jgi:hypothetical protein
MNVDSVEVKAVNKMDDVTIDLVCIGGSIHCIGSGQVIVVP